MEIGAVYALFDMEDNLVKKYGVNELRKMFLDFFESKGHLAMKSFSLVPHNDNSLLLINSGMAPLKPYFTGQEIPSYPRVHLPEVHPYRRYREYR